MVTLPLPSAVPARRAPCTDAGLGGPACRRAGVGRPAAARPGGAGRQRRRVGLAGRPRHDLAGRPGGRSRRARRPAYRLEHLPPVQRGLLVSNVEAAGTPILLVHGIVSNRSIFTLLRRGLTRRGFSNVFAMNYLTVANDVRAAAAGLSVEVERVVEETGFERIHIIGHSLGGLIARYYVTRLGGDARVHTLITLGTPHEGSYAAYAVPTTLMQQMRPGQPPDARARPAGARLPHPVHLVLVRQRLGHPAPAQRGPAAPRPRGAQHQAARGGAPQPADAARGRARHLDTPWPTSTSRAARSPRASPRWPATSEDAGPPARAVAGVRYVTGWRPDERVCRRNGRIVATSVHRLPDGDWVVTEWSRYGGASPVYTPLRSSPCEFFVLHKDGTTADVTASRLVVPACPERSARASCCPLRPPRRSW